MKQNRKSLIAISLGPLFLTFTYVLFLLQFIFVPIRYQYLNLISLAILLFNHFYLFLRLSKDFDLLIKNKLVKCLLEPLTCFMIRGLLVSKLKFLKNNIFCLIRLALTISMAVIVIILCEDGMDSFFYLSFLQACHVLVAAYSIGAPKKILYVLFTVVPLLILTIVNFVIVMVSVCCICNWEFKTLRDQECSDSSSSESEPDYNPDTLPENSIANVSSDRIVYPS